MFKMSSEIKNTIGLLCKLINLIYGSNLKPELFRLAKFNKTDENVVPILWNTLGKILDDTCTYSIQKKLRSMNYNRNKFYALNTEINHGSRELLLALVFLISLKLEQDLKEKLDINLPDIHRQTTELREGSDYDGFNWKTLHRNDLKNYKKWLCGKICFNNNEISEYKEQIEKIQRKYNKSLDMKAHSKMTIYEILALKNKHFGEQFLQDTEPIAHIMSIYMEWVKKEKQFWKWMNTVLEEDKKPS